MYRSRNVHETQIRIAPKKVLRTTALAPAGKVLKCSPTFFWINYEKKSHVAPVYSTFLKAAKNKSPREIFPNLLDDKSLFQTNKKQ